MHTPVISIIGAGNMGSSLIGGLIKDGHPSDKLWAADPSGEKLTQLKTKFDINTTSDNAQAIQAADTIIFAVKPQAFAHVALPLKKVIAERKPLVISIAAGIREASIQQWLNGKTPIVRAMPNTPALIGCGATALYANPYVTESQRNLAESILRAVGVVVWLNDEKLMDTVTALSGSGPAYFFLMMEALQEAAEDLGLPTETARLLTLQTALGAARMAIESGTSLAELRRKVTSPGGTTEKAISVLEENNIRRLFKQALQAAKLRSEELATLLGKE
ncbi:pyrroline-5-carboxylate reductase [Aquicella lusitana]|uniref:Pyrroline-5-carboxylate reductase n=1 Tax=Aquicella lusitana TaxID=254246 RepID=A0A370GC11_9COXI|nr:pyrroline-5-carboxylate reductase [Aquicella lusitana]RDI41318.1 pyrroline-5-carboxylate reductase [Aquicella lusitana]VVC72315.1 Pyrroline-5-carboxylate reductase [Aquicella lusitana]